MNLGPQFSATQVTAKAMVATRLHAKQLGVQFLRKAGSAISGFHDSRFRGRGMDYLESRVYQSGDDIRNMDWLITARTGEPHTKLFQEERERPTYLVLDCNAGMFFATKVQFKMVLAAQVAAFLGWSSVLNGDRIGVLSYGINGIHSVKATAGKRGMMAVMSHILEATDRSEKQQTHQLSAALQQLRSIVRPGSLILLISDFFNLGEECKRHLLQLRKHNDILGIKICDPFELQLPPPARYGVQTGQAQNQVLDSRQRTVKNRLSGWQQSHFKQLKEQLIKSGVPLLPLQTNDRWVNKLRNGLSNPTAAFNHWQEHLSK